MSGGLSHVSELERLARAAMTEQGLLTDFSPAAMQEVAALGQPALPHGDGWQDLRRQPWCSIDNDDSLDLDQLTLAEALSGGRTRVSVAIADVAASVGKGGAVDEHARHNTTSVYTPGRVFPMLPRQLSEDLTSLADHADRSAVVIAFTVDGRGAVIDEQVTRALVRNHAKLAYDAVGAWLIGSGPLPPAAARAPDMEQQLRIQDAAAQAIRRRRDEEGALEFELHEASAVFADGQVVDLRARGRNRATELIENFMITANGVTARFLAGQGCSSIRRVVRSPDRWQALVELAAEHGMTLPPRPDSGALQQFLARRRQADPTRFPDLSLTVIKLMGRGEYVVLPARGTAPGHFGLAVRDYLHATAPNRRFPDLVTQRTIRAVLDGRAAPYPDSELRQIAMHCTDQETVVDKVERRLRKSAAALLMEGRIGERFDAIVTGASEAGTWARLLHLPVEGKVVRGGHGQRVGRRIRVKLAATDVERGFIDFERV